MIRKSGDKFVLVSKLTGKVLGRHSSRKAAQQQERAIHVSKRKK